MCVRRCNLPPNTHTHIHTYTPSYTQTHTYTYVLVLLLCSNFLQQLVMEREAMLAEITSVVEEVDERQRCVGGCVCVIVCVCACV